MRSCPVLLLLHQLKQRQTVQATIPRLNRPQSQPRPRAMYVVNFLKIEHKGDSLVPRPFPPRQSPHRAPGAALSVCIGQYAHECPVQIGRLA